MELSTPGTSRYFRNFLIHQTIEETQRRMDQPMMASAAKHLNDQLRERLAGESANIDRNVFAAHLNTVMHENVPGYPGVLDDGPDGAFHEDVKQRFAKMVRDDDLVPVSPYDSLWQGRSTMREAGHELLYVRGSDVGRLANGSLWQLHEFRGEALQMMGPNGDGGLEDKGPALSLEDKSGLTALSGRMTQDEYRAVRRHVLSVGEEHFMSAAAVDRAAAVLDSLREDGVEYEISADRNPGQIKARLTGTKLEIRLMDVKANEHFAAARVYDDGVATRFTTSLVDRTTGRTQMYSPTAQQAVDLVRVAQGKSVRRWDDSSMLVGQSGTHRQGNRVRSNAVMAKSGKTSTFVVGELPGYPGETVSILRDASAKTLPQAYLGEREGLVPRQRALGDLGEYVTSARENFTGSFDVERLVAEYTEHADAAATGEYFPEFSGEDEAAAIQRSYWDVLRGAQDTLLRPGVAEQEYLDEVEHIDEMGLDADAARALYQERLADLAYVDPNVSPEDMVRQHAVDASDDLIGTLEPRAVLTLGGGVELQRFNPARVARHMTSEKGYWGNREDVIAALRAAEITPEELAGDGFQVDSMKDQLIAFDPASAQQRSQVTDPFIGSMIDTVTASLERAGAVPQEVLVDDQGVIQYTAVRQQGVNDPEPQQFQGQIGQVFSGGQYGEVVTQLASSDNYMMVPGYLARIAAQQPGENKTVEERTILRGFEQVMTERIEHQVATDALSDRSEVGSPASLNGVYRGLYDTRHEPDFVNRALEQGMDMETIGATLETESRRVRYSNEIAEGSTLFAEWRAKNAHIGPDMTNDNFDDPWVRTGGRNMAIMTEVSDGYFDPVMTNGATGQGTVRFLVESAQVADDGTILRGALDDAAPLRKLEVMQSTEFDPYDRQQMTASNLMNASSVAPKAKTAMMTFGGWTFDDPVVVSKAFAEANGVRDKDDNLRPLVPGDKISDFHGNKGVVSLVVDPELTREEAEAQGISEAVGIFQENSELDVVMSPFSAASRFNGGTARELLTTSSDVTMPGGRVIEGGLGEMNLIITHKDVDSGTRVYGDDDLAQGRGRKASAQLAWALGSHGAEAVMAEFYGPNNAAAANFREMAITMGLDMRADGTLTEGRWDDQPRHVFEMPELIRREPSNRQPIGSVNHHAMNTAFAQAIDARGGEMELPFPLTMPTGKELPEGDTEGTWRLPVLSAHLRSGQDMDDGVAVAHDHTRQYLQVFKAANMYRDAQERLQTGAFTSRGREGAAQDMQRARRQAQGAYDTITRELESRRFSGKNNIFKEGLMSARQPDSATAVWTADPRLDIHQLGMGTAMAESMGLTDGDDVMVWRDPVLRDSGVRYMEVAVDERLTGASINPVMDKSFDGDFDGDSVGIVKLQSNAAKAEAMQKLSVQANLLDEGLMDENGFHPLNIQDSLDMSVAQFENPALAEQFEALTVRANDVHADWKAGELTDEQRLEHNTEIMHELSDYYTGALSTEYGNAALRFDSPESHLKSVVEACVDTGAKGSEGKIGDYAEYFGAEVDFASEQPGDTSLSSERFEVKAIHEHTLHTREQEQGSMRAVAVKSFGTGIAGAFSQRGVKALRNEELKAVLELTYPVTQSVLQSKHDPAEADAKYQAMLGPAKALWGGAKLEKTPDGPWEAIRDQHGDEVMASVDEWKDQFVAFYEDQDGLNIRGLNSANIDRVARALSDPQTGKMLSIEEPEVLEDYGKQTAVMDRLAYGGDFKMLHEAAKEGLNIFDGKQNGHFAPQQVQKAQAVQTELDMAQRLDLPMMQEELEAKQQALAVPDVLPEGHQDTAARGGKRRSDRAVAARAPRSAKYADRQRPAPVVPDQQPVASMTPPPGPAPFESPSSKGGGQPVTAASSVQPDASQAPNFDAPVTQPEASESPRQAQPTQQTGRPVTQPVAPARATTPPPFGGRGPFAAAFDEPQTPKPTDTSGPDFG